MIEIVQLGDLIITVIEHDESSTAETRSENRPRIRETAVFRVNRETLANASPVFERMLNMSNFKEATSDSVELEGDHVKSMEIWFRAVHNAAHVNFAVPLSEIWYIIAADDKYNLDITVLRVWFEHWYDLQSIDMLDARKLLYPCFTFDHAKGFMKASRKLVYESIGHIT